MLAHRLKQSSQICKKSAQPTSRSHSRDRQRRSALPSTAARTPYHLTGGAQIPIAQAVPLQSFSRGFLPWRFSDASRQHKSHVVSCGRHPKTFTEGDIFNQREYVTPGQARLTRMALALGHSLRALYRLPHTVRRRGHINAVDAKWTQRINDRIDDDGRSADGAGFADTFHPDRIGLATNFF